MMTDLFVVTCALLVVGVMYLPLIGAQKKSLTIFGNLQDKATKFRSTLDDDDKIADVNLMVRFSRSWLFSLTFLFVGPILALINELNVKKKANESAEEEEITSLLVQSLFFSNPLTMGLACVLIVFSVGLGKIILFTFLSFCSLGGDGSKLDTLPSKPAYELVVNLSSIYRNIRFSH
ncbi:hypothetical protein [Moritella yayanosii]|uniref:Uncharacterized protein n=1 Tax=Moritella yayanosii TaxID=69539 RepID=A0A330LWT1_9GAMM|nr:hypothetical protein [Moritella yayanosii]SQD80411.1 membrane protein of unknown function [Moritella yayanosii]